NDGWRARKRTDGGSGALLLLRALLGPAGDRRVLGLALLELGHALPEAAGELRQLVRPEEEQDDDEDDHEFLVAEPEHARPPVEWCLTLASRPRGVNRAEAGGASVGETRTVSPNRRRAGPSPPQRPDATPEQRPAGGRRARAVSRRGPGAAPAGCAGPRRGRSGAGHPATRAAGSRTC